MSYAQYNKKNFEPDHQMDGKTKITTDEIIAKYPGGIDITSFTMYKYRTGEIKLAIYFDQELDRFYWAGAVLTDIITQIIADKGSEEAAKAALANEPMRIILKRAKTKAGRDVVRCDIIDSDRLPL